jgi:2-deoxy-scyllo-inosamine dehydrogenase (SAM-dependent)/8-amino-3,8-dideoxy-alpha-D-manno-octulosonate transaminase
VETAPRIPLFERLQIESQSNCNRACWFCPRTYDRSGRYLDANGEPVLRHMPTGKILDLLDQARAMGFRGRVGFHHYSEPLLDKRNVALARAARERGMEPYLHTNGDALGKSDRLCAEVREVYRIIVVGLYDHESDEELEEAKAFWRRRLDREDLGFSPIGPRGVGSGHSIGVPRALVPTDPRMAVPDLTFANAPCHRPLIRLIVQHDGEMCNCFEDLHGDFRLGNVHESSIEELWYSERHVRIAEDLVRGHRESYSLCRNCPMPPTGRPSGGEEVRIDFRRYAPEAPATPASA